MNNDRKIMASPSKTAFFLCCRFVIECGCIVMAMPQDTCTKITPISISNHSIKMLSYDSLAEAGRGIDSKKEKSNNIKDL